MIHLALVIAAASGALTIEQRPANAYVERSRTAQTVDVDLAVTNGHAKEVRLDAIEVSVLDRAGRLQFRRFVDGNGLRPGIDVIGERKIAPGATRLVFNPVARFEPDLDLRTLAFDVTYAVDGADEEHHATLRVTPVESPTRPLRLPVAGPLIVWDGNDLESHHRRFDFLAPQVAEFAFRTNPGRYAYDFVTVDADGAMVRGDRARNESWLGFGAPILAAAAGTVVVARDGKPDDGSMDMARLKTDHAELFGNQVVVKQDDGAFAMYAHVRQGSVACKAGDRVRAGQRLAAVGRSGSALFPHLHFQLQTAADADGEGLPSTFERFRRRLGSRTVDVDRGAIDSGDIVETR
jgi:peptidase M23-like protein